MKSLSYACAYVSGVIVAAVDLCQSFKKTSERSPAKQAALALAAATAIAAFAGQAKAQDEVNYSFFNSQLSGIDNEAQSDIMSLRNAVAGYDLTSLKNSFNTYAPAFAQLDSDFNAYSAQLSSDQQTFQNDMSVLQAQSQQTQWDDMSYAISFDGNYQDVLLQDTNRFNAASQEIDSFQSSHDAELQSFYAPVPEPSTCAMALAGLACGGYSLFRHRRAR